MPALARLALVEADVGDLGLGVGAPGHHQGRELPAPAEERVLHHDLRGGVGRVGELPGHAHVAGGVDAAIRGAQPVVDLDAPLRVEGDARRLEPEPLDVRRAARGDQQLVDDERPRRGRPRASGAAGARPPGARPARSGSRARDRRRRGRGRPARSPRRRRPRARARGRPSRAGAPGRRGAGTPGRARSRSARRRSPRGARGARSARRSSRSCGSRRRRGPGSGGAAARAPVAITARRKRSSRADLEARSGPPKRASPRNTSTPNSRRVARRRVLVADARADLAHALHRVGEGLAGVASPARRACFAAAITAFEGTQPTFRQSPPIRWRSTRATRGAEAPGDRGGHEPGGAGADDHQVVAARRHRVPPVGRVDVREQRRVRLVAGQQAAVAVRVDGSLISVTPRPRPSPRGARGARGPSRRSSRPRSRARPSALTSVCPSCGAAGGGARGVARHAAEVHVEERAREHAEAREQRVGEAARGSARARSSAA